MAKRIAVKPIALKETLERRKAWLVEAGIVNVAEHPGDKSSSTRHLGALGRGSIVGVVSLYREPRPALVEGHAWRMRGLAVGKRSRGAGVGRALIEAAERFVLKQHGNLIWSNVAGSSIDFFAAVGFERVGDAFGTQYSGDYYRVLLHPRRRNY